MLRKTLLQIRRTFEFGFLRRLSTSTTTTTRSRWRIARHSLSLRFGLLELRDNALVMRLNHIFGNTFHAEDLHIQPGAVGKRIIDGCQLFFVHLAEMDGQSWSISPLAYNSLTFLIHRRKGCRIGSRRLGLTACCVEFPITPIALEVLRFLM